MHLFAETAESISKTTSKLKKIAFLSTYIRNLADEDLRAAVVFFTGRPFPLSDSRTLNVGWSALASAIQQISQASEQEMHRAYLERGDLGEVAEALLPQRSSVQLSPAKVQAKFGELVKVSGANNKLSVVTDLLRSLTPIESKYAIKIITGDLRIGLKENSVEEGIAKAFERPTDSVRRANMVLGDIGETAVLALHGDLINTSLKLFRPVKFMLATPGDTEEEIFATFTAPFYVEDKYDGVRGQLHVDNGRSALYSRTLDDISFQFPEITEAGQDWNASLIADGEVVGFKEGRVLPFSLLQKRLGRKKPPSELLDEIPVALMVFDILHLEGRTLIDEPLSERKEIIESIPWPTPLHAAPFILIDERVQLAPFFEQAALRRNEGLMLKDASSLYFPGKRGMNWLKWKKALATLDVVVTGVEFGHGRRRDVLSDFTFAVQQDGELFNIGKAYSGLTDREIAELTDYFKRHTVQDFGRFRLVEPRVVIEVAFNGIQKSSRHESGYALRFPRIIRIRNDKSVQDIDTLENVKKIHNEAG